MMIIGKKEIAAAVAVLCLAAIGAVGINICRSAAVFDRETTKTIIVDAGHGDPDGGAVGKNGTLEKDVNLAIALKLTEVLEGKDFHVIMTRMGDASLSDSSDTTIRQKKRSDMNTRLSIMKNSHADLFVSIHMNSYSSSDANGLHIFYAKKYPELESLATQMQERISAITGATTHVVKTADENLFLMKNPPVPAILAECGFLSNEAEEKKLNDEDYQSRIAWAIAESIEGYLYPVAASSSEAPSHS